MLNPYKSLSHCQPCFPDYLSLSDDDLSQSEFDFDFVEDSELESVDVNKKEEARRDGHDHAAALQTYKHMAQSFAEQDKPEQAVSVYKKALNIQLKALGPDHTDTAETYHNMARAYAKQGKVEKAIALFQKAFGIYCRTLGPDHPSTVKTKELMEWMRQDAEDQTSEPTTRGQEAEQRSDDSGCIVS